MELKEILYGVEGIECSLAYGDRTARDKPTVILLHGYSFNRMIWIETGIASLLDSRGIPYVLPDMPYGRKTTCTKKTRNIDLNVSALEEVVRVTASKDKPVIVGASLGGRIALYYAVKHPVKGLLLASPAIKDNEEIWGYIKLVRVPTLIIRGDRDTIPLRIHRKLAEKLNATLKIYKGAGHAMYLVKPDEFAEDIVNFYRSIVT